MKFPLLKAAYDALEAGGSAPIVLNAADEVAVGLFLAKQIAFDSIARIVLESLEKISGPRVHTLQEIIEFHEEVVRRVSSDQ